MSRIALMKKGGKWFAKAIPTTRYWKYIDISWTQPILTANGTIGGNSFAVYSDIPQLSPNNVFNAFDGVNTSCFHSTSGSTVGYIIFYNPNPIKVTNIQVCNQNASGATNRASLRGTIYGSNDNSNWKTITTYTNTNGDINGKWNISLASNNNYYKYYKVYSNGSGSSYWTIGELTLTAYIQTPQESTLDDYDYTTDGNLYYAFKKG